MNLVEAYSSDSDSDSDSNISTDNIDGSPRERGNNARNSSLNKSTQVSGLIPRQVRFKEIRTQEPEIDEEQLEILRYEQKNENKYKDESVRSMQRDIEDIFGVKQEDQRERKFVNADKDTINETLNIVEKFKSSSFDAIEQHSLKRNTTDEEIGMRLKKRKKEKGLKMQEINMSDFYRQNSRLIKEGKLDVKDQIRQNASPKYFSAGNNNLAHIIQFTEKNKTLLEPETENENKGQ